jgi:hypothetical protein
VLQYTQAGQSSRATRAKGEVKMSKHFIGMAGMRGCLPNMCDSYPTRGQAAESLGLVHELSGRQVKQLRRDGFLELNLAEKGNEICEIVECNCGDPDSHNDC